MPTNDQHVAHSNAILLVLCLSQLMDVLDTSVVNVALPTISKSLHLTGITNLQWLITAYGLTYAGFLLLAGRLADLFGRRRIFILGVLLFGLTSLAAGLSTGSTLLILWRGLQGMAAACMTAAALSSLLSLFAEGKARNRAMVIWGMVAGGGVAVGLVLGGVLTQYLSWRWIFFINVPITATILAATPFVLPRLAGHGVTSLKRFDLVGAILATSGLIALVYGFTNAPSYGWSDHRVVAFVVAGTVLLTVFLVNELWVSNPLLHLRLLVRGNIGIAGLISIAVVGSNGAVLFFLSLYNQQVLGYSPLKAGLALLPLIALGVVVLPLVRKLLDTFGYKPVIFVQLLILTVALLSFARLPIHGLYITNELPSLLIMACGVTASIGLTLAATSGINKQETGVVSGVLTTAQQVGGPLVLAVLATISATFAASVTAPTGTASAMVHGTHAAFVVAAAFEVVAIVLCVLVLKRDVTTG